jgi:hypothetical protein
MALMYVDIAYLFKWQSELHIRWLIFFSKYSCYYKILIWIHVQTFAEKYYHLCTVQERQKINKQYGELRWISAALFTIRSYTSTLIAKVKNVFLSWLILCVLTSLSQETSSYICSGFSWTPAFPGLILVYAVHSNHYSSILIELQTLNNFLIKYAISKVEFMP